MAHGVGFDLVRDLVYETPSKIVLLVMDGLGGLPHPDTGMTELETARTPNMDRAAQEGITGLSYPVAPGITPGSGPGHLALFGYDPITYDIGRGILEVLGSDMEVRPGDIAVRGNFCTVDGQGVITDRRAGRIATAQTAELCARLSAIKVDGAEIIIKGGREHRFAVIFRGPGLSDALTESDPQREGVQPRTIEAKTQEAQRTADIVNQFVARAREMLKDAHPANMPLLRGFSKPPTLPAFPEVYKLRAAAVAAYPMYRGLSKLLGMSVLSTGDTIEHEFQTVAHNWKDFDFFFVHVKGTDSAGEDGDFDRKVRVIEAVDGALPALLSLKPDVLVITGDHSTPAILAAHSWHPVPILLRSRWNRSGSAKAFSEREAQSGGMGAIQATSVMPLAMANALKLVKYGA